EQLRKVAEPRLDDAGHAGAETVPQPVDTPPDDGGEEPEGQGGHDEGDDTSGGDVSGEGGRAGQERAGDEEADIATGELGAHGGCLASDTGVVVSGHGPHFRATIRPPATAGSPRPSGCSVPR